MVEWRDLYSIKKPEVSSVAQLSLLKSLKRKKGQRLESDLQQKDLLFKALVRRQIDPVETGVTFWQHGHFTRFLNRESTRTITAL